MKYSKTQIRRLFQEIGFEPNLLGYEILIIAVEVIMEKSEFIYENNMDSVYNLIIEKMPSLNANMIRKNIENLINKWWENSNIQHPIKDRIIRINGERKFGTRLILCYIRDEILSRDEF